MFSTLWFVTGSVVYLMLAAGLFLRLQPERKYWASYVIVAAIGAVPFVGFPYFTAGGRIEESQRSTATLQIDILKQQQAILDRGTGAPKEDRYLDAGELRRLIDALAHRLPVLVVPPPDGTAPPICDYLYLYAWFLAQPELPLNTKWNAALFMPRLFYKPDTGLLQDAGTDYDALDRDVRRAWAGLRQASGDKPGLTFCPDPP